MLNKLVPALLFLCALFSKASFGEFKFGDFQPSSGSIGLRHIQTKKEFIEKNLKTNGHFDPMKINLFIGRIQNERDFFLSNLYETALIEEIELQISKPKKAIEEAREEIEEKKSDFAVAFDEFLLPRLNRLSDEVQSDYDCESICIGIIDEFLEIYSSFYTPNKYRNYFNMDFNWNHFLARRGGYTIEKNKSGIEASNLVAPKYLLAESMDCLGESLTTNTYLNQKQIQGLKRCGIDISKLNPGKSVYWKEPSESVNSLFSEYDAYFPDERDEVYFKSVKFSGKGSPKINGEFKKGGVEYKVKLKIGGYEAHAENFVSRVGKLIGFNQDVSQYRESQDVIFKDKDDWNEFRSFIYRKYGHKTNNNLFKVEDWGNQGKIVTFRHVSIEISPDNLYKLSSADPFGWDRKNLREYRGALLWFGYFNLSDTKNSNWRIQLRETEKGLVPEMSLQDVGFSLGSGNTFNNIIKASRIISDARNVNMFQDSFLVDNGESVTVKWVDPLSYRKVFDTTTWSDLKWMARKILRVTTHDIKILLSESGFSEAEQELYLRKISARRDEIIDVFNLGSEYEKTNLGDYRNVNIEGVVANGEVINSSTDSVYEYVESNILLNIGKFIQQNIDVGGFDSQLQASIGNRIGATVNPTLPISLIEDTDFTLYIARPGVELGFSREVRSAQFVSYENQADHKYYAIDRYTFGLTTRSGIQATLSKFFPVEMRAKVSHFKLTFDHYRPFTTPEEALKAPATILHVLPRLKEYIHYMRPNESITYANNTEFSFRARVGNGQNYRVELRHERQTSEPITVHRNHFGEIQIFQEKVKSRGNYVRLSAGVDTPIFYIPLMSLEHAFVKYNASSKMFYFPHEVQSLDTAIGQYYADVDQGLIDDLLNGNSLNPLLESKMEYELYTNANRNTRTSNLLYLLSGKRDEIYSNSKLNYNGEEKSFHRYYYASSNTLGLDNKISAHLLWSKDKTTVEIQMDEDDPEDFVIILNNYDFKKDLTKFGLDAYIQNQNRLYSKDNENSFFAEGVLPPAEEVNHYKKVMSHVRVFLFGKGLLEKLDKYWDSELKRIVSNQLGTRWDPVDFAKARSIYNKLRVARTLHRQGKITSRAFLSSVGKAVYALRTREKGVEVLRSLFGKKHMFIMGEIHGVLPSFSYTQEFNNKATRRFTGNSWGKYRKRPPFWKYLKDFPIQVRPGLIPYRISDDLIFSQLPDSFTDIN